MKNILVLGAGRSSFSLINYLLKNSTDFDWKVTVGDVSEESALQKTKNHPNSRALKFDVNDQSQREKEISSADIVISLLPPSLHLIAALDCLKYSKSLITASYVSAEIRELEKEAKNKGILLLNEMGLDPGIDHMSAMHIIERLKASGADIVSFKSYCGGLVAPESNDNPWGYKFSWNPRNVIVAGQGTAKYLENGRIKYLPYNRLFKEIETTEVHDLGYFDAYANRDSISYKEPYGLNNTGNLLRGTLRMQGYCRAWNVFVQLGITDDTYHIFNSQGMSHADFISSFLPVNQPGDNLRSKLASFVGEEEDSETIRKITWTGILDNTPITLNNATPAQVLQDLLEKKWILKHDDKDMIVMQHEFEYNLNNQRRHLTSSMVVKGIDEVNTAMAQTVGLPVAIAAKLILTGKINLTGVHIPTVKEIYDPVLKELENYNVHFKEKETIV